MKRSKVSAKSKLSSPFETVTHNTEWTCAAKIAEWMNNIVKEKDLPLGKAAVETTQEGSRKRVDLVLFESPTSKNILCVLEFKPPYFDPFDEDNLKELAREKAVKRKAKYFATSNFKRLIWFNTERVNKNLPEEEQIHDKYNLSEIESLDQIEEHRYKSPIISALQQFLTDIYQVHTNKKAEPRLPLDELLVCRLQEKINTLSSYYKPIVRDRTHKDTSFRRQLSKWFNEQNWSFSGQEQDFYKAARQAAYLLVNKIFFYNLLQAKRPHELDPLSIPEDLTKGGLLQKQLEGYFEYVLKNIDYETIYSTDFIDQTAFPDNMQVVEEIKALVRIFKKYDFSKIGFDIIGRIFERLIPTKERHNLGQYFTNPDIVDLILRFCLKHEDDEVLDPACGAGTFLVRAYQHKKLMNQRLEHQEVLKTLWGVDIAKFPAHLATINLAINDLSANENYPHVLKEDFFNLQYGGRKEVKTKAHKKEITGLGARAITIPYPRFVDCVVGNPPYTRQEEIPSIATEKGYKEKLIENALFDGTKKLADISKRAGIYAYFFVHGTKFLKDGGRFGFVVSTSWLDTDYGKGLQELFLTNYKIICIIESKVERWFEEADINTCIIILEKCPDSSRVGQGFSPAKERDENLVRFVYLFKSLRHFIPPAQDMWEKQLERLRAIDPLINTILAHDKFYQNDELRIFPKKQAELWEEGFDKDTGKYVGAKWGKYLRAPEIFFKILEKGKDKLVPLKSVAEVKFGIKTGANAFFYLTEPEIMRRNIEKKFWMHRDNYKRSIPNYILKSFKESPTITIEPTKLQQRILLVHEDKKNLINTSVLKYIKQGERQNFGGKIPSKTVSCSSRGRKWYDLGNHLPCQIFYPRRIGDRFLIPYAEMPIFCSDNLFPVKLFDEKDTIYLAAYLNSVVLSLFNELSGRRLTGAINVVDLDVWMAKKIFVLNPNKVPPHILDKLAKEFDHLRKRPVENTLKELNASTPEEVSLEKVKPDRRELDKIVMGDILGLTEEEQLEVYRAVVDLVKSRLEKAKSLGKRKKTREGIDIDLLVKSVMEKVGDETLGRFYKENVLTHKTLVTKELPRLSNGAKIEKDLFGWRINYGRKYLKCTSEAEAKYLKVFMEASLDSVKIPKDERYLKRILPELLSLKQRIDKVVEDYIGSIVDIKTREKIEHQLWAEITKLDLT